MNLPNKLTLTRLCLTPVVFVVFKYFTFLPGVWYTVCLALLYIFMELSDLMDGKIARRYNLVTDLGKIMDPFGDVIAHLTFFICFMTEGYMPVWAFAVIFWREVSQSFLRTILMGRGKALQANIFGKAKTVLFSVCIFCNLVLHCYMKVSGAAALPSWAGITLTVLYSLAATAGVVSFVIYVKKVFDNGDLKGISC